MEAALRTAYYLLKKENPDAEAFQLVRGLSGIKEAEIQIDDIKVRAAVAHGLGNARKLIEMINAGEARYDFVEIMACPGGCSGGGGQPFYDGLEMAGVRGEKLYKLDRKNPLRFSHENPEVIRLYDTYLGQPMSELAHKLLHVGGDAHTGGGA